MNTTVIKTNGTLASYIDRIEVLLDERVELNAQIKSVYDEAGNDGIVKKALRAVIGRKRAKNKKQIEELDSLIELYETSI